MIEDKNTMQNSSLTINSLYYGDVLEGMSKIPDSYVDLIFTSPPYNVNINYQNREDNQSWEDYLEWLFNIWKQSARVLKSGGRLIVNIDSIVNRNNDQDGEIEYFRPIYADLVNQMRKIKGMNFRNDICWFKHQVVGRATAWGLYKSCSNPIVRRNHEYILVWCKDSWSSKPNGRISDLTDKEFQEYTMSMWHIKPETRKLGGHPVPFPEELVRRVVKLYSFVDDVVLDPFCGVGTTPSISSELKRNYIGIDNCKDYLDFAEKRIKQKNTFNNMEQLMA